MQRESEKGEAIQKPVPPSLDFMCYSLIYSSVDKEEWKGRE